MQETTTIEHKKMPLTAKLSKSIHCTQEAIACLLNATGTEYAFRPHLVIKKGQEKLEGIEQAIRWILRQNGAEFALSTLATNRQAVLASAMYAEDVYTKTFAMGFGNDRYPLSTIRMYLSSFMQDSVPVKLENWEDSNRAKSQKKPRKKYFLALPEASELDNDDNDQA